ncbi:glutathione transferase [Ranunculus cassubicifolius]
MAVLKVHGSMNSTAVMRVVACLYEKDLEFEFVHVNMSAGDHKRLPYTSLNPFGQVPAFEDGDLKLFESRAITNYIAHEYAQGGTEMIYKGMGKKMAIVSVWMEVEAHQFDPIVSNLNWELVIKPMLNMPTDESAVEENKSKLAMVLDVYETRLTQSKYLAGDEFTMADLHHCPNLHTLMATQIKELFWSRPYFWAWCTNILARPSWAKVLALQNKMVAPA